MKTAILLISLLMGRAAFAADSGAAGPLPPRYIIGVSPFLEHSAKDPVYRRIVRLMLEDVPLGSTVAIYDAFHLRSIAQVDVPDSRAFRSAKTRANQFKEPIRRLKDFLAATHSPPSAPQESGLEFGTAIALPQFLRFLSENAPGHSPSRLIILGSPLYMDAKEPGFSMCSGYFPSDGHLRGSLEQSVYGVKDLAESLPETDLHFGYFGDPFLSDAHREKILRFWSLYAAGLGARLATFSSDLATVFAAALQGARIDRGYELHPAHTRLEMLRVTREIGVADWITRDAVPIASAPPSTTKGPLKIGIRWRGNIDLDLYASPRKGAATLFFEKTRSPEGYYFKDHRSSPEREFEFIEFEAPVDVHEVRAWINFYEGRASGGAEGEVRVEFDGRIYSGHFALSGETGNKGRSGPNQREFWNTIDLPAILRLPDSSRAQSAGSFP